MLGSSSEVLLLSFHGMRQKKRAKASPHQLASIKRLPPHPPHLFSHILAALEVMVTVREDFGFHNGDNSVLELRDRGDGQLRSHRKKTELNQNTVRIPSCKKDI